MRKTILDCDLCSAAIVEQDNTEIHIAVSDTKDNFFCTHNLDICPRCKEQILTNYPPRSTQHSKETGKEDIAFSLMSKLLTILGGKDE